MDDLYLFATKMLAEYQQQQDRATWNPNVQRRPSGGTEDDQDLSSWRDIDLNDALEGKEPLKPTMLIRTDDRALIYPGKIHWFQGEAESMKSLAAQYLVADLLLQGENAIYVDFEDDEYSVVDRLRGFGVPAEVLLDRTRFRYIHPEEPTSSVELQEHMTCGVTWAVVVFDGVTEGMVNDGLNYNRNEEIALWVKRSLRVVTRYGAAGIAVDHVPKNHDAQEAGAIGGVYKRNAPSVSIQFKVSSPLHRAELDPTSGTVQLILKKDKHGWVRQGERKSDSCIALMEFTSYPDGGMTARVLPPDASSVEVPDHALLMTILKCIDTYSGIGVVQLRKDAGAKAERTDHAVKWLKDEGYITIQRAGNRYLHDLTDKGQTYLTDGAS